MTTVIEDRYAQAWSDLGERLTRGLDTLEAMPYEVRRADKIEGLATARYIYDEIVETLTENGTLNQHTAWSVYTTELFDAYRKADERGATAAYRSGLALGLEYQRGYGDDIDAPALHLLQRASERGLL